MKLHLDFETKSEVDIKKVGAWAYARHPSTEILCMAFKLGDQPVSIVRAYELETTGKRFRVPAGTVVVAHNAPFEYAVWNYILHERMGWHPLWEPGWWRCTMAKALMVGMPASLENVGAALNLKIQKDLLGRQAMHKLCKPKGYDALGDPIWNTDYQLFEILHAYCMRDVETEAAVDDALPDLPPAEQAIWEQDLIMNRRGVPIDVETAKAATEMAASLTERLNAELTRLTKGAVDKASRVAAIKTYLEAHGIRFPTPKELAAEKKLKAKPKGIVAVGLDKAAILGLLEDPQVSDHVKAVIKIRQQVGKSSTAKFKAMVTAADPKDGRVRGVLQYHAAHTGRWGGRLIQPQNFPAGVKGDEQSALIAMINERDSEMFELMYGDGSMQALSNALRGTICASEGHTFISADYNAIEARTLFWLADDALALSIYKRGESPYVDMAQFIYSDPSITKKGSPKQYDLGKRAVLGCGFGMGWKTFKSTVKIQAGDDITEDLARTAVKAYRAKYRSVVNMWYKIEGAAINAVKRPGTVQPCCGGKVAWGMSRKFPDFLVCRLPSGRFLWYNKPSIVMVDRFDDGKLRPELHYWGVDSLTKKWCELKTYGGALTENITQAVARDLMANGMQQCEKAGYPQILTVHDELLGEMSEADFTEKTLEDFMFIMCTLPKWAAGLPVAAEGWVGKRYRK